jgi:hypothetical protein
MDIDLSNSSPAIMPLAASYFGVLFLKGRFSIKNGTYCPLFSHDTTFFKGTCLLIKLKEAKVALYVFNGQLDIQVLNNIRKRTFESKHGKNVALNAHFFLIFVQYLVQDSFQFETRSTL